MNSQSTGYRLFPSITNTNKASARPIIRWAGGKQSLVPALAALFPKSWGTYFEPLLGGGALFFHLQPKYAVISDTNADLINYYKVLRDSFEELKRRLLSLSASRATYYALRDSTPRSDLQRAIRFAYLNRLAWNGLYRVNREGRFNVPIGDRLPETLWSMDDLLNASRILKPAKIQACDFRLATQSANKGDIVFFDPPYPKGSRDKLGFNRYSSSVFALADHKDLAEEVRRLSSQRVRVLLTLANVPHLIKLYPKTLKRHVVRSRSLISCNGSSRRKVSELLLTNY